MEVDNLLKVLYCPFSLGIFVPINHVSNHDPQELTEQLPSIYFPLLSYTLDNSSLITTSSAPGNVGSAQQPVKDKVSDHYIQGLQT